MEAESLESLKQLPIARLQYCLLQSRNVSTVNFIICAPKNILDAKFKIRLLESAVCTLCVCKNSIFLGGVFSVAI